MIFKDRDDAANKLAEQLIQYKGKNPLILAIPRGAVPMAQVIADVLGGGVLMLYWCASYVRRTSLS